MEVEPNIVTNNYPSFQRYSKPGWKKIYNSQIYNFANFCKAS